MNEKSAVHFGKCQLDVHYGNTGCQIFKGGTKLERFCLRINIPKGNYWILGIGVVGSCRILDIILEN